MHPHTKNAHRHVCAYTHAGTWTHALRNKDACLHKHRHAGPCMFTEPPESAPSQGSVLTPNEALPVPNQQLVTK